MEWLLAFEEIYRQLFGNVFEAFYIRGLLPLLKVRTPTRSAMFLMAPKWKSYKLK